MACIQQKQGRGSGRFELYGYMLHFSSADWPGGHECGEYDIHSMSSKRFSLGRFHFKRALGMTGTSTVLPAFVILRWQTQTPNASVGETENVYVNHTKRTTESRVDVSVREGVAAAFWQ